MTGWRDVLARAAAMLARPGRAWDAIAQEPPDVRALILRCAAPLAAIPAVCGVVGAYVFGFNVANVGVHADLPTLLLEAAAGYLTIFPAIWAAAALVHLLVRAFGGELSYGRAVQVLVYAMTPYWLGGVAQLYPSLGLSVGILGALWSLWLFHLGIAALAGLREERRLTAFAVMLAALAIVWILRGAAVAYAAGLGGPLSAFTASPR